MAVYQIRTKIDSNVAPNQLYYDLSVYRWDKSTNSSYYLVLPVIQAPLQKDHFTSFHQTVDTDDPKSTIYMVQLRLYRKYSDGIRLVWKKPFIRMYSLADMEQDAAYSHKDKGNGRYYETTGTPAPTSLGGKTVKTNISEPERQFEAKDYPAKSPDDPFEETFFNDYAAQRCEHSKQVHTNQQSTYTNNIDIYNSNDFLYPYQGWTSLCGSAAFFFCLLMDRPDVYQQAAYELWHFGETRINQLRIKPDHDCRHPHGNFYWVDEFGQKQLKVSGLDWVTLASLRDGDNHFLDYDEVSDKIPGINFVGDVKKWFEEAGYHLVFDNTRYFPHSSDKRIDELNKYAESEDYWVVSLVSASILSRTHESLIIPYPNHWIVWMDTLQTDYQQNVSLNLFSWGEVKNHIKSEKNRTYFKRHTFGALVFKRLGK